MLKQLEEEGKYVGITGFRDVQVPDAKTLLCAAREKLPVDVEVQFFDADLVATWEHLYFAVLNALVAFKTKRNVSKSVAVEAMLYASAHRQIAKAIDLVGVKKSSRNVAAVVVGDQAESVKKGAEAVAECIGAKPDETVLELSAEKTCRLQAAFDISETEVKTVAGGGDVERALVDLVIEKVALLSTQL